MSAAEQTIKPKSRQEITDELTRVLRRLRVATNPAEILALSKETRVYTRAFERCVDEELVTAEEEPLEMTAASAAAIAAAELTADTPSTVADKLQVLSAARQVALQPASAASIDAFIDEFRRATGSTFSMASDPGLRIERDPGTVQTFIYSSTRGIGAIVAAGRPEYFADLMNQVRRSHLNMPTPELPQALEPGRGTADL